MQSSAATLEIACGAFVDESTIDALSTSCSRSAGASLDRDCARSLAIFERYMPLENRRRA
jgi:hypothetical protein